LSRAENLYQIKRGHNGVSRELAAMIAARYPSISAAWLLTGEGDMFVTEIARQTQVPFYDVDIEKYIVSPERYTSAGYVSLPDPGGAEFAARYCGRAMGGAVPTGSTVLVRKEAVESLVPGGDYLVVGRGLALLRRVRREAESLMLRLVAVAGGDFDDIRLDISAVKELYRVCAIIIDKTI
jgi:hypothetical protein